MQFLVLAYDDNDEGALSRRLAVREQHMKGVEEMAKLGRHLYAAAILDEKEQMIGSALIVDFPTSEELDEWLKAEPYVVGRVWKDIEVKPCRVAPLFAGLNK